MAKAKIESIQVFRGVAALAVVAYHSVQYTDSFIGKVDLWVYLTLGKGMLGVDFFFVLSGFIIMYVHQNDNENLKSAITYLKKRFIRLYPVYWCTILPLLLGYALFPELSMGKEREISVITSIFLLPTSGSSILSVAWTLVHEVIFYISFLLFFISSRLFSSYLILWVVAIFVFNIAGEANYINRYIFSIMNIEFFLGVVAVKSLHLVKNIATSVLVIIAGIGAILFSSMYLQYGVVGYVDNLQISFFRLFFATGMAFLILGFVYIEGNYNISWPSVLVLLGNASYSIYLIHAPLLSITQRLFGKLNFGWGIGLMAGCVVVTLAGIVFHFIVEKNAIRGFKKILIKKNINQVRS